MGGGRDGPASWPQAALQSLPMNPPARVAYTWDGAARRLERLAKANAQADEAWLAALSTEESIRIFEDLCQGIPEISPAPHRDPPPVVLFPIWRP